MLDQVSACFPMSSPYQNVSRPIGQGRCIVRKWELKVELPLRRHVSSCAMRYRDPLFPHQRLHALCLSVVPRIIEFDLSNPEHLTMIDNPYAAFRGFMKCHEFEPEQWSARSSG